MRVIQKGKLTLGPGSSRHNACSFTCGIYKVFGKR